MKGRNVFRIPSEVKTIEIFFFLRAKHEYRIRCVRVLLNLKAATRADYHPHASLRREMKIEVRFGKNKNQRVKKMLGPSDLKRRDRKFSNLCRSAEVCIHFHKLLAIVPSPPHRCHPNWNFILNSNFLGFALRWLAQGSMKINSVFLLAKKTFLFGTRRFYCPHFGKLEVKKIKNEI